MFLKQKQDQSIKGRMVSGGNNQRGHINKIDATSPTAELESVLLTSTIDAKEGRDVAIIDIPMPLSQQELKTKRTLSPFDSEGNWLN